MQPKPGRFIDPLSDFGFKHLFGNEPNKDILIDFLNQLFKGQKEITDLTYNSTEHAGDNEEFKKIFFDLLCTGKNGEQFIIEMQRAEQRNFSDRAVFYTSRLINEQLPKGASHWNVELKEVYLIAILEFNFKHNASDRYLHNVGLANTDTGEIFYNKLGYKFLELCKFVKTEAELETDLDRWFYLLKHMSHLDKVPAVLNKRVFQKIFKIAEVSNLTKEERAMYDSNLKSRWDYENSIEFAKEEAGHEKALDIARELKKEGSTIQFIAKITKLPIEEIEKL
ncbi:MAG TPA: Rpn family recombination-promoting nuclease/putative transposase [Mucilaginibacter sp.]|jgi:predicted transposase/invertase (TIGR01784 family)|nr:Rpn family recombination-promoting nuclease/putative transposase [Mucilaginibacter sp.]